MTHLRAKSSGDTPLLEHLLDVCSQAREFWSAYRPTWPLSDGSDLRRILVYAALLHDFGKIHPRFQAMLCGGPPFDNRHEILSLAFLNWLEIPPSESPWLAAAIATHHRGWYYLEERYRENGEHSYLALLSTGIPQSDACMLYRLLTLARQAFEFCGWRDISPYPVKPHFELAYSDAIRVRLHEIETLLTTMKSPRPKRPGQKPERDWLKVRAAIHARGWMLSADHLASLRKVKIQTAFQSVSACKQLYPNFRWAPHQEASAGFDDSGLLIAPTGSGKTEAALLWASRQAESGLHGRLCFLLPYQTSLNAMQRRLVERAYPELAARPERWSERVGLLHGRASRYLYESFLAADHAPPSAERNAKTQNQLARLFASPVTLSTVFSLIRLLFATRGAERLFVAHYGARIVIDEIHAYTSETTALTLAALQFIKKHLKVSVLLMSATVPQHLEQALKAVLDVRRVVAEPPWNPRPRHVLSLLPFDSLTDEALEAIRRAAAEHSVLVVVNQVKRAIRLRTRLAEQGLETTLLHSRFHFADRAAIEANLTPARGKVLVATQAVEVSLDLDFEVCFSELAPLEALAQRFGRCNRRSKLRAPANVYVFSAFPASLNAQLPYDKSHLDQVYACLAGFVASGSRSLSDSDIEVLLNESYPESLKNQLNAAIVNQTARLKEALLDTWQPFGLSNSDICGALEEQWEELFNGEEVLPRSLCAKARECESTMSMARYLVPVSAWHFRKYQSVISFNEELSCHVIDREYSADGLNL